MYLDLHCRGTRGVTGGLRHCPSSRKVEGSMPDGVIEIFHQHNPSGRYMVLGSTQPLNKYEYQEYFPEGEGGWFVRLTNLPPSCTNCLEIWELQLPGTLRACSDPPRDCITFFTCILGCRIFL